MAGKRGDQNKQGSRNYRGNRNNNSRQNNNNKNSSSNGNSSSRNGDGKKLFEPYYAGKQHIDTYDSVKEQIILRIQSNFKDGSRIVKMIRSEDPKEGQLIYPTLVKADLVDGEGKLFTGQEKAIKDLEQEENNMIFREKLRIYNEEKKQLEDNIEKAYALIFNSFCSKTMQNRIEEKSDFETAVRDNPIELLKRIKQSMYVPTRSKYEFDGLLETMKRFVIDTKQTDDEDVTAYSKRFKQANDIFTQSVGKEWISEFIKNTSEYASETDDAKKKELLEAGAEKMATFIFMKNSHQKKYGELVSNLKEQYALGNDQYPKTLRKAVDALSNHKWDDAWFTHLEKQKNKRKSSNNNTTSEQKDDSKTDGGGRQFTQKRKEKTCYCCGKLGHLAPDCPDREKIPHNEWYMYKAVNAFQENESKESEAIADNKSDDNNKEDKKVKWTSTVKRQLNQHNNRNVSFCGLQRRKQNGIDFKWDMLLDTGSEFTSVKNKALVDDIVYDPKGLNMNTNAGGKSINTRGTMHDLKTKVWTDEEGVANIFSFADLADQYHVQYDNNIEDAFVMTSRIGEGDTKIKFPRDKATGLYAYRFSSECVNRHKKLIEDDDLEEIVADEKVQLLDTVAENRKNFTTSEYERAKRARTLYHNVGAPSIENFKGMLRSNWIQDCPVIEKDIDMATETWDLMLHI